MPVICATELKYTCPIVNWKLYMALQPAVFLTAAIAYLSLTESTQVPSVSLNDKLIHAAMYLALAIAWLIPLKRSVWVLLGTTAFGGFMELMQHYCTTTRSGDLLDLLADFVGATIGIILVILWQRLYSTSR